MPKKPNVSQEDIAAFHKAVEGVKRLVHKKIRLNPRPPRTSKHTPQQKRGFHLHEQDSLLMVQGEEFIVYKQAGVSDKILRKLRKGQYNVEAVLDLHGMSVEDARWAVDDFLQQCLHRMLRVVLIIHGKGHNSAMPVLKNKLNHWLRTVPVILAFCSAAPLHGNRGAMYLLLKRTQEGYNRE